MTTLSKKQLAEQRRYDMIESDVLKTRKKATNNGTWFLDYCKKYSEKVECCKKVESR